MNRLLAWVLLILLIIGGGACTDGKQSAVEGKLVDWNGKPVAGAKITADQVQRLKGYEHLEAVTAGDGSFRIKGLFPSSAYVLTPRSDKWTCEIEVKLDSAPQGETAILPDPMEIHHAYAKNSGSAVLDLATGKTRFTRSTDGIITDSETGLEWVAGPDQKTDYSQAKQWVDSCKVAGGGWGMPTRANLKVLYQPSLEGFLKLDPIFKIVEGRSIWAEPQENGSAGSAWFFYFGGDVDGGGASWSFDGDAFQRVFGMRARPL